MKIFLRALLLTIIGAELTFATQRDFDYRAFEANWHDWKTYLSGPVRYLLTQTERKRLFEISKDKAAVRNFAGQFWLRRDPHPYSRWNAYQADIKERILEADRRYREEDIPGWQTHRGIFYIVLGEPDQIYKWYTNSIRAAAYQRVSRRPMVRWWFHRERIDPDPENPPLIPFTFINEERDGHFILLPALAISLRGGPRRSVEPPISQLRTYQAFRKYGVPSPIFEFANRLAILNDEVDVTLPPPLEDERDDIQTMDLVFKIETDVKKEGRQIRFLIPYQNIPYIDQDGRQQADLEFYCRSIDTTEATQISHKHTLSMTLPELAKKLNKSLAIALGVPGDISNNWECWFTAAAGVVIRSDKKPVSFRSD